MHNIRLLLKKDVYFISTANQALFSKKAYKTWPDKRGSTI